MRKVRLENENNHHLVFNARAWCSVKLENNGSLVNIGEKLRGHGALIVPMDMGEHARLHEKVEPLPALGSLAVKAVYDEFSLYVKNPETHPARAIDHLQLAIERVPKMVLTSEEEIMAERCLESLDIQKPLIRGALDNRRALYEEFKNKEKDLIKPEKRNGRRSAYVRQR